MKIQIQKFNIEDYENVYALWEKCDGIGLSNADTKESIERYLNRNQGMSFVAKEEGTLVGAILAGHDGRRGYIHHLAVNKNARRRGIGMRLVEESFAVLSGESIEKCHIFVFRDNLRATDFWVNKGWNVRMDLNIISKEIGPVASE